MGSPSIRPLIAYDAEASRSQLARMLGELIEANVTGEERRRDFDRLQTRVGVHVSDLGESVTMSFQGGHLFIQGGLAPDRNLTIHGDSETVLMLGNVEIGFARTPNLLTGAGKELVWRMVQGRLRVEGVSGNLTALTQLTRIFSVHGQ
jgi:hypothetical protein